LLDAIEDHPGMTSHFVVAEYAARLALAPALAFAVSEPVLVRITKNRMLNVWPEPRDQDIPLFIATCLPTLQTGV